MTETGTKQTTDWALAGPETNGTNIAEHVALPIAQCSVVMSVPWLIICGKGNWFFRAAAPRRHNPDMNRVPKYLPSTEVGVVASSRRDRMNREYPPHSKQ